MRWLRLALALAFLFAAIDRAEPLAYAAAIFFGLQAVFNVSCCGAACAPVGNKGGTAQKMEEVTYEEIK